MEFFLVPLLAITGVTLGIYKLAGLIFHIRLSRGLLAMLVAFAWLVSLVLPAMFYHSAGFMGSLGISLIFAAGFAWVATLYDAKTRLMAVQAADLPEDLRDEAWSPAAETAEPVGGSGGNLLPDPELSPQSSALPLQIEPRQLQEVVAMPADYADSGEISPVSTTASECVADMNVASAAIHPAVRNESELSIFASLLEDAITNQASPAELPVESRQAPELDLLAAPAAFSEAELQNLSGPLIAPAMLPANLAAVDETPVAIEAVELDQPRRLPEQPDPAAMVAVQTTAAAAPPVQPVPDALPELLEYAFEQRSHHNLSEALAAFRAIRRQYSESEAVPLVEAEMISTLQSCGDYAGALEELELALELPVVHRDRRLSGVFEQKRTYLKALQALLKEQGTPNLPFEQIPSEWSEWLEGKLSAGAGAQS